MTYKSLPGRVRYRCIAACFVLSGVLAAQAAAEIVDEKCTTATRLLEEARQAQIDGDTPRYFALLRDVVRLEPENALARWQLGQLQLNGEWLAVEEAQRRAAADPRQAEYRQRRQAHDETAQGQLALARWCRKSGLADEAQFHWASVLSVDPNNEEALRAVDRRWHNGRLLTREEVAEQKKQMPEAKRATKRWAPTIAKWRREISGSDARKRAAALEEIRLLTATDVISALEAVTLGRDATRKRTSDECRTISRAFVEALAKMPEQAATESLVRHAVYSPSEDVRTAAIEGLKPRPQHDYVPLLLSGLAMPVESSFQMRTEPDGSVHYTHSLYREGPDADWALDMRRSVVQHDMGGHRYIRDMVTGHVEQGPRTAAEPAEIARVSSIASRSQNRFGNIAASTEWSVAQANAMGEALNALIVEILKDTTGQDLGDSPKAWWDWWRQENEYYAEEERPIEKQYVSDTESYYYGQPAYSVRRPPLQPSSGRWRAFVVDPRHMVRPVQRGAGACCFSKGTLVWTKTGQVPIESIELGDMVLSQNMETIELCFKPVIGRIVRARSSIVKLGLQDGYLRTSAGHPLWVAGIGWRMAKELEDGAILHGIAGSPRIQSIAPDGEEEAYNLIVADFNTYFVGDSGVLVHDNTPRRPTRATVPGLAAK